MVRSFRDDAPQLSDGGDGRVDVMRLEPLAIPLTDKHQHLNGIHTIGAAESTLTANHVEL